MDEARYLNIVNLFRKVKSPIIKDQLDEGVLIIITQQMMNNLDVEIIQYYTSKNLMNIN